MADERMDEMKFKDAEDEYAYNLIRAEYHIRQALLQITKPGGPRRSLMCKTLLARAHGIITGLYTQESAHRRE